MFNGFSIENREKIIHQIWFNFSKTKKGEKPNNKIQGMIKKCKLLNPDWKYILWTEEMAMKLLKDKYEWFIDTYNKYEFDIQRVDAIRYFILFTFGGFYIDMDVECLVPFTKIIFEYPDDLYFVESPNCIGSDKGISNSIIYSKKGHSFINEILINLEKNSIKKWYHIKHSYIMYSTGPSMINKLIEDWKFEISTFPAEKFNPFGMCDVLDPNYKNNKNIYTVHHNFGSWESGDSTILKSVYCGVKSSKKILIIFWVLLILFILFLYLVRRK